MTHKKHPAPQQEPVFADFDFEDIPDAELSAATAFYDALNQLVPEGTRLKMDQYDTKPLEIAKQIRKRIGKKKMQRFVRDTFPDIVEGVKDLTDRSMIREDDGGFMISRIEYWLNKSGYHVPTNNATASIRYHVILLCIKTQEWWR